MSVRGRAARSIAALLAACLLPWSARAGDDAICAKVAIEVSQDVTLERQAFDAYLRINNGYSSVSVEDVDVDIWIMDDAGTAVRATTDPNDETALFFVRLASLDKIDDINGSGKVLPDTTAEIHWLIVPAPGAAGQNPNGTAYQVGGKLHYRVAGEESSSDLLPDRIYVRPMPQLVIDYFLPGDVYGDDAFTEVVEPSIPFPLGMRVMNSGFGKATSLNLESASPRIVNNDQQLQIGFEVLGTEVNGVPQAGKSLKFNLGTVDPNRCAVAVIDMECSLSGRFTEMDAQFTHADGLGGKLTSLIKEVNTHLILAAVMVDQAGRDRVRDFLAEDADAIRLYESDAIDRVVSNFSDQVTLSLVSTQGDMEYYRMTLPGTIDPLYARVGFQKANGRDIVSANRLSDGSRVPSANVWFSQKRRVVKSEWDRYLNLFDAFGGGDYEIAMKIKPIPINTPPSLQYIGRKGVLEGQQLGFLVEAHDPDGTVPSLGASPLPTGATFTNNHNGTGVFQWRPQVGAYGVYPIKFTASDGEFTVWRIGRVYVGHPGEALTAEGVPESLADWDVSIKKVESLTASGVATVQWDSVNGLMYELYASDNPAGSNMVWTKVGGTVEAAGAQEQAADTSLGTNKSSRFYRLVLAGDDPDANNVWGVIRRAAQAASYTLVSPPLRSDRKFDGDMGRALAEQLLGDEGGLGDNVGDEVYVLQANGSWRSLYLDTQKRWRESNGQVSTLELQPGQGFFVARNSSQPAMMTFTGPVGNDGSDTSHLVVGWNILGLSQGRSLEIKSTFAGSPARSGASEDTSDMLIFQNPNGSWRRLMYVSGWGPPYDGNWFDLSTFQISTNRLEPGAAYYYFRQPSAGAMDLHF